MINLENRISQSNDNEIRINGYFLTIDDLTALSRDFMVDCRDGYVSYDISYIEAWLKKHKQIVK